MNWTIVSYVADVLGIASFIVSLGIFRKIYAKTEKQKESYSQERVDFLAHLRALRDNFWQDGIVSDEFRDKMQTKIFEYQIKYIFISSPRCMFHALRCTKLLKNGITSANSLKIREDLNFLIARLSKEE